MLLLTAFLAAASVPLDVVILPHSHCDAGYRETFAGYYRDRVRYTISSVVDALLEDPNKRFVWQETSYFQWWWSEQTDTVKASVRKLASNGQLEFIGGGWVMHDEADGTVAAEINQMELGLAWMQDNLNIRPRIQWHVDPFGHSSTTSTMHAMMGYDVLILNRMPHLRKQQLKINKHMDFIWKPQQHAKLGDKSSIFVHVLDSHYSTPPIPVNGTVHERATFVAQTARIRSAWFRTPVILIPFGGDFEFTKAAAQFQPMDEVLEYINTHRDEFPDMTLRYGTLMDYFVSLRKTNITFPVENDSDFFPYIPCACDIEPSCRDHANNPCGSADVYWTGFFTSKPGQKLLSSKQDASLRAAELLFAFRKAAAVAIDPKKWWQQIQNGRFQSALYQHHDAITGTAFVNCTVSTDECDCYGDYTIRLTAALQDTDQLISEAFPQLLAIPHLNSSVEAAPELIAPFTNDYKTSFVDMVNKNSTIVATVMNSLVWDRKSLISLGPMTGKPLLDQKCVQASSSTGAVLPSQFVYDLVRDTTTFYFSPDQSLPAMGLTSFFIRKTCDKLYSSMEDLKLAPSFTLNNGLTELSFVDGKVTSHQDVKTGKKHVYQHDFIRYGERLPTNSNIFTGSNIYSFFPNTSESMVPSSVSVYTTATGPLVWEIVQVFKYVAHTFRLLAGDPTVYNQIKIGGLPQNQSGACTVALRLSTNIEPTSVGFNTISNSYTTVARVYDDSKPIQGNYYPTTAGLFLGGKQGGAAVGMAFQRSVGVTGGRGWLEAILHRQIIDNRDTRGLEVETVDEIIAVSLTQTPTPDDYLPLSLAISNPFVARTTNAPDRNQWLSTNRPGFSMLKAPLDPDVHILDLKSLDVEGAQIGLRLGKLAGTHEVKFSPSDAFPALNIHSSTETTLDYKIPMKDLKRWEWQTDSTETIGTPRSYINADDISVSVPQDIIAVVLK